MNRAAWFILAVAVALFLGASGAIVFIAARTKRGVFDQVKAAVLGELAALRPDLEPGRANAAAEILAAQAVFETVGGVTPAWVQGWNFGNVTSGGPALWKGAVVIGPDTEYAADGSVSNISQLFRKYASLDDAVHDYLTVVLQWYRERQAGAADRLFAGDAEGYTNALYRAGYYTLPAPEYFAGAQTYLESFGA